ncbi:eCIS core domain-containing protein [Streptomyces sp. URMC 124]|uniref:eCIS core domain-containing protein n=1 Tax=Streptomyces sp. URMC 124 TaxID=3423405 RepID=UPI003F1ADD7E
MGGKEPLSRTPDAPLRHTAPGPERTRAALPRSPGVPLDHATRQAMSARFSYDFSRVRTHSDDRAADLAAGLHARAYTVGHDVVFGRGMYAPHTAPGRALLAHELGHVVQQSAAGVTAVQRSDVAAPAPTAAAQPADPEEALGRRLVKEFPNGVALAFYAPMPFDKEEARTAARTWAKRENALAVTGKKVTAATVAFGEAMADEEHPLTPTVQAIGSLLNAAVAKAPPDPAVPPGVGPATVRTLALFAHGTPRFCGVGDITPTNAASVIKGIAPSLAPNVTVVFFTCNAGRAPEEKEEWEKQSMRPGGKGSLASVTRDALIAEGKGGSVWGHSMGGHVAAGNPALREFGTDTGKGSEGASFITRYVFTAMDKTSTVNELLSAVSAQGYELGPGATVTAGAVAESRMYYGYAEASGKLTYDKSKLAEAAPTHPVEVGKMIKDYWTTTYWPANKDKATGRLLALLTASGQATKRKQ